MVQVEAPAVVPPLMSSVPFDVFAVLIETRMFSTDAAVKAQFVNAYVKLTPGELSKQFAPKSAKEVQAYQQRSNVVEEAKSMVGKLVRLLQATHAPPFVPPPSAVALDKSNAGKDVREEQ